MGLRTYKGQALVLVPLSCSNNNLAGIANISLHLVSSNNPARNMRSVEASVFVLAREKEGL